MVAVAIFSEDFLEVLYFFVKAVRVTEFLYTLNYSTYTSMNYYLKLLKDQLKPAFCLKR
jgi:hypothetical protein